MTKKLIIEFIGTFFLVLTVALTGNPVAIGFVLVALVYMGGYISGAHYNPAVTASLWYAQKIDQYTAVRYMSIQMLAGIVAAAVFYIIKQTVFVPAPGVAISMPVAFLVEVLFTFLLMTVIYHVAVSHGTKGNPYYGLAIGMTVLAVATAGGPISGGAYNPAVGVGPLLFDLSHLSDHLGLIILYTAGPVLGALLASLVYKKVQ